MFRKIDFIKKNPNRPKTVGRFHKTRFWAIPTSLKGTDPKTQKKPWPVIFDIPNKNYAWSLLRVRATFKKFHAQSKIFQKIFSILLKIQFFFDKTDFLLYIRHLKNN